MSWLARLVAANEEQRLQTQFYGGVVSNTPTPSEKFSKKVRALLEKEVAAGHIDRESAFAMLRWIADAKCNANADWYEARNSTTPRIHSGNLPESKFNFFKKGN
jgi:hypothetical protein